MPARFVMKNFLLVVLLPLAAPALAQVSVQEYPVPRGHYVHDVWADASPGGPVWFSAQRGGELGILDPKSGKVEFVPLGSGSSPHGVIAGADGAPWLTDGGQNAIVRVDPKTRQVKAWPLPEGSGYTNLNTAIFDTNGVHWFTGQSGIYGRLDPRSGEMKVFDAPKGRGPYGIHVTPQGVVYYASLAGSHIARIDAVSGAATVIEPPTRGQGARRVWSDSKGGIWVAEWNSGNLSRYEPSTGKWSQWKAPGSSPRVYAVYVDETDKVWASEWSAQVMLRFDPASEKFETFKSSSPNANVRQIHGRKGEIWTPESAADKIVVYRYAQAQTASYPTKAVQFVVPFAAGSATDQIARAVGQEFSQQAKQPVIVDNKPGASGFIAAQQVAKAAPDGHTVFITTNTTQAANEHLYKKLPYDPVRDFAPVTALGRGGNILIVQPKLPAKSIAELIKLAKAQPGKLSFGSGSSASRVSGELFQQMAGVQLLHVPYKSNPLAVNDLLGGQIDMIFTDTATGLPQVKGGKVRALGVTGPKRSPLAPEVPAIGETVKGYELTYWFAAYLPAKTPQPIVDRVHALLVMATKGPTAQTFYGTTGTDPFVTTPAELAKFQAAESQKWGRVIKAANIEPE